jgi:hypothetical protein
MAEACVAEKQKAEADTDEADLLLLCLQVFQQYDMLLRLRCTVHMYDVMSLWSTKSQGANTSTVACSLLLIIFSSTLWRLHLRMMQ